jgi:hypothetical protein
MILRKELKNERKRKKKYKRKKNRERSHLLHFSLPPTLLDIVDNYFLSPCI